MNTVLVTGAYGFLGRYTSMVFRERGWRVIGLGHGHWGFENPADFGVDRWIEAEIDFDSLGKIQEELDCVVHCAGGASVGYSVLHPLRDFKRTVASSINILEYLRVHHPGIRFVYPSSAAVYGRKDNRQIGETEELCPVSPYGFHKRVVEELCASYAVNYGLSSSIVRFFSIYGTGLKKQLLWDACNKFSNHRGEVRFFGRGNETRDWIHVKDAARLIYHMAESQGKYEILNGGSGETRTIGQILTYMGTMFTGTPVIRFNQNCREGDPEHYWADIAMARDKGWEPVIGIEDGLKEYVEWYKRQKKN